MARLVARATRVRSGGAVSRRPVSRIPHTTRCDLASSPQRAQRTQRSEVKKGFGPDRTNPFSLPVRLGGLLGPCGENHSARAPQRLPKGPAPMNAGRRDTGRTRSARLGMGVNPEVRRSGARTGAGLSRDGVVVAGSPARTGALGWA